MPVTIKIKRTGDSFKKLSKSLQKTNKTKVDIGYFAEQGIHQPSGRPYPEQMALLEFGDEDIPPRPVFRITSLRSPPNKLQRTRKILRAWAASLTKKVNVNTTLDRFGSLYSEKIKNIFGKSPPLTRSADLTIFLKGGRNTPLIDTGDLKSNLAYKNSIDKEVKKNE